VHEKNGWGAHDVIWQEIVRCHGQREDSVEKDVVCGMQVDPAKAAGKSEYNGKTYYFCSPGCKKKFDANPSQYAR
jgi:YHS domain-containing protein